MRLHGWCTECRRAKLVRVSNHAMAMLAIRQIPTGICDDCERKAVRFEYAAQHVASRAFDRICRRRRIESGYLAEPRFVDDEFVERDVKVGTRVVGTHEAVNIVARNDVIMSEARKRPRATHLDDDARCCSVDAVDGRATSRGALVLGRWELRRRRSHRWLWSEVRRAACQQRGDEHHRQREANAGRESPHR